jgi:UTP--glucose-1-phosphate uridylyltransferase
MTPSTKKFAPFARKMKAEGIPEIVIQNFEYHYMELLAGRSVFIAEEGIIPLESLPDMEELDRSYEAEGARALPHTVIIKLNGGLGTSMGLEGPKSLIMAKNGLTFLDIVSRQASREGIPLILMNSFATHQDSLDALQKYPELRREGLSPDFVQHKVPKILQHDLSPAVWPANPSLEWSPPGHGDIYTALVTGGLLHALLEKDYRYAFISNSDNLGAVMNKVILGYFAKNAFPFLMEAADRTEADKKGGHLARCPDGQLILRERAQCPQEELSFFQDIERHGFFNTNNIWVNLQALKDYLKKHQGVLPLPLIRNAKTLDPRDPESEPVYQLETAMGSALSIFEGAQAIRVPRSRFLPVKTTSDLFVIYSDIYDLTPECRLVMKRERAAPVIDLDPDYYTLIDHLQQRFPSGPPSLIECDRLAIKGDFRFGRDIKVVGSVKLVNTTGSRIEIPDGKIISKDIAYSAGLTWAT